MTQHGLETLKPGDVAVIHRIRATRPASKRLADMGFIHGAALEMVRAGFPCIVRIGGVCVALGAAHQASIELGVL